LPAASAGATLCRTQQRRVVEGGDRDHDAARLSKCEANLVRTCSRVGIERKRVAVQLGALERREPNDLPERDASPVASVIVLPTSELIVLAISLARSIGKLRCA
jgi:hypothetical protein